MARRKLEDGVVGTVYFKLTLLSFCGIVRGQNRWLCKCECGTIKMIAWQYILKGRVKSCGCYKRYSGRIYNARHGEAIRGSVSAEYRAWNAMLTRCYNKNAWMYHNYGGRGIAVCERWRHSFENFLEDMGRRPTPKHTVDRFPDNNGNYCKENCRWATRKEQGNNTRKNVRLNINGEIKNVTEWAAEAGVSRELISSRMKRGWSAYNSVFTPIEAKFRWRHKYTN